MDFEITQFIRIFVALLAIVNPIGAIPVFLALMTDRPLESQKHTIHSTSITVVIALLVSAFLGRSILNFFGISIGGFQIGGGILISLMGMSMLQAKISGAKHRNEEAEEALHKENLGAVPLGIPLLAGPGAITLVIVEAENASGNWWQLAALVTSILLVSVSVYVALQLAPAIAKRAGQTGINIFTRVMGLIILAIAVEFITTGIAKVFPALGG